LQVRSEETVFSSTEYRFFIYKLELNSLKINKNERIKRNKIHRTLTCCYG